MSLMLNRPGGRVPRPEAEDSEKPDVSPLKQIAVISIVALYLLGIVWLYVQLPLLAVAAVAVAGLVAASGAVHSLRRSRRAVPDRD